MRKLLAKTKIVLVSGSSSSGRAVGFLCIDDRTEWDRCPGVSPAECVMCSLRGTGWESAETCLADREGNMNHPQHSISSVSN